MRLTQTPAVITYEDIPLRHFFQIDLRITFVGTEILVYRVLSQLAVRKPAPRSSLAPTKSLIYYGKRLRIDLSEYSRVRRGPRLLPRSRNKNARSEFRDFGTGLAVRSSGGKHARNASQELAVVKFSRAPSRVTTSTYAMHTPVGPHTLARGCRFLAAARFSASSWRAARERRRDLSFRERDAIFISISAVMVRRHVEEINRGMRPRRIFTRFARSGSVDADAARPRERETERGGGRGGREKSERAC